MAPTYAQSSRALNYPLWTAQFDPEDAHRLVVGGGGGSGMKSGVANKLTILDTSDKDEIREAGELAFPTGEDSVMALAFGPRKGKTTCVYAGVNPSAADAAKKGKKHNLRAIAIETGRSRGSVGAKIPEAKTAEVTRSAFFSDADDDSYVRVLRVRGGIGAAATAGGKDPQLAVFEASGNNPALKGVLELEREAEDVDVLQTGEAQFQVAYAYKQQLYLADVGKTTSEPRLVFTLEDGNGVRPSFRSIRWLSPTFILSASNLPGKSGVVLHAIRLPGGATTDDMARIAAAVTIPGKTSSTALAVVNLSPPATPLASLGDTQFLIAVAGSDSSIYLYTMAHTTAPKIDIVRELYPLRTLKNVHDPGITSLSFSPFTTPKTHVRPQHVQLASTAMDGGVVVQRIPLKKFIDKTPRNRKGPPRPVRYIVEEKSQGPTPKPVIIALTVIVLIMAVVGQSIMEMYGQSKPILHVHKILPSWHGTIRSFDPPPAAFLRDDFVAKLSGAKVKEGEKLVIWEGSGGEEMPNLDVHDEAVHGPGMTWEELGEEQKQAWKDRLADAGAWTQGMGESVFKGILFGEMGAAVGRAMGG